MSSRNRPVYNSNGKKSLAKLRLNDLSQSYEHFFLNIVVV